MNREQFEQKRYAEQLKNAGWQLNGAEQFNRFGYLQNKSFLDELIEQNPEIIKPLIDKAYEILKKLRA